MMASRVLVCYVDDKEVDKTFWLITTCGCVVDLRRELIWCGLQGGGGEDESICCVSLVGYG